MIKTNKIFAFVIIILFLIPINSHSNVVDELTKLNNLYKEGAITKEEFSKAKTILLKNDEENKVKKKVEKKQTKTKKKVEKTKSIEKKVKRSFNEDLSKTFLNIEDVKNLGEFKKLEYLPEELFHSKKHKSFPAKADKSMKEMYKIFVTQKALMEKYPENAMKGMAYFEYFYMNQLKDKKKSIETFINSYPNFNLANKKSIKDVKTLYSLNSARQSMREAVGLSLDADPETALKSYIEMYKLLSQAEKTKLKLSSKEKSIKKRHNKLKENLGKFEKSLNNKKENRISFEDFKKENKKTVKNIKKSLVSLSNPKNENYTYYKNINNFYTKFENLIDKCLNDCEYEDLDLIYENLFFTKEIIKDTEKNIIKKEFKHDMSNVDMSSLSEEGQKIIIKVSLANKIKKKENIKKLQMTVLNLDSKGMKTNTLLDDLKSSGFEIKNINMTFDNVEEMKNWKTEDWAKSWRTDLPDEIKDTDGNLIQFSNENIQDLKAQLAMNTFKDIIDLDSIKANETFNENIKSISQEIAQSGGFDLNKWLNEDVSITLDNYSRLVGNDWGIEINDFSELTTAVNDLYGSNVSPSEYAKMWDQQYYDSDLSWAEIAKGVDLLDQVGSFDAASIAKDLGADLQQVADTIAQAAAVGVSTDLEAAAQGLGYGSFADAVAAYNKQYGTNYSVDEAREALGQ